MRYWQTDDGNGGDSFTQVVVPNAENSYTATGLAADTEYTIRVLYRDEEVGRIWKASPHFTVRTAAQ